MRILVAHKNVPNVISKMSSLLGNAGANISDMVSKSRGDYAFLIFDLDNKVDDAVIESIRNTQDVIRVRVIEK